MPKMDGRSSSRKTVKTTKGLFVGSFLMRHEEKYLKRPCVIEGCDHKLGPTIEMIKEGWEPCSGMHLPAFVARQKDGGFVNVGLACPCHVGEILDAEA